MSILHRPTASHFSLELKFISIKSLNFPLANEFSSNHPKSLRGQRARVDVFLTCSESKKKEGKSSLSTLYQPYGLAAETESSALTRFPPVLQ